MSDKVLLKGTEACAMGAILAGCRHYFGYPITPQTEIPEYFAKYMPEAGGVFLQAESEIAAISMVYGAAATGRRTMTSSSGPGLSLKQETISTLSAAELPCLIVNVARGGPGLGCIQGAQSDYFQSVKGGGHGDYRLLTLAPNSVQEMMDLSILGFELADKYRNPVLILSDGVIGQMMEPVGIPEAVTFFPEKPWAATGAKGRGKNLINSLYLDAARCEEHNRHLQAKFARIAESELRYEEFDTEDAELVLVAYGISSRIALSVKNRARAEGLKVGLLRPITLWPFPSEALRKLADRVKGLLVVEQSAGQMVEDVRLAVCGRAPVAFHGRPGGVMIQMDDVQAKVRELLAGEA
ncbi:MAG: 3-methyl-2-oxobutanoate dehydrogenase subunit VorB [Candidatus Adiutrix sp.]|jgi:2-oxoglutarate ferredoxin oxidoreductase subunit alpha|nr:3-methyl-2-oxobutanoate dehydrogenase subunit VorB [Candidatus Adiutrix sp.]